MKKVILVCFFLGILCSGYCQTNKNDTITHISKRGKEFKYIKTNWGFQFSAAAVKYFHDESIYIAEFLLISYDTTTYYFTK